MDAFAGAVPGTPSIVSFTIMNVGDGALDLGEPESLSIHGPDAAFFAVEMPPALLTLNPLESTSFSIALSLDSQGIRTAYLTLHSSDPNNGAYQVTMTNILSRKRMISAGWDHTVAVREDGQVWAWGENVMGQLGDGTTTERAEPVPVLGLAGIVAVAAGGEHTLALKSDGTVWAWGYNLSGEVGDGTNEKRTSPVPVGGLNSVVAIAAGAHHSVALTDSGTVWAWGCGRGNAPGVVGGLSDITAISSGGGWFTLALAADKTVWAWGNNEHGQLGDGTKIDRGAPVPVSNLTNVTSVAAGMYHSSALDADGNVWLWGGSADQLVPLQFTGLSQVTELAASTGTRALRCDGTVWVIAPESAATPIDGLSDIVGIAGGNGHWIALKSNGSLLGWGMDEHGQLGSGVRGYRTQPVRVIDISDVTAVSAGFRHSLALDAAGNVWAWGENTLAQLGLGNRDAGPGRRGFPEPEAATGMPTAAGIAGGHDSSVGLTPDGQLWVWGWTALGLLDTPEQSTLLSDVAAAASGMAGLGMEIVALKQDGTVWHQRSNTTSGQVTGLTDMAGLDGYNGHLVLKADGTVWEWEHGSPVVQVAGISGVVSVASGGGHAVAATDSGTVWTWGSNSAGQLGDGTTIDRPLPAQIAGLSGVVQAAAGQYYSLALKSDGTVWAWGWNGRGQLGDGTTTDRTSPVQVTGLTNVTAISAYGGYGTHSLALDSSGDVWAWGSNEFSQIGDGVSVYQVTPVEVIGLSLW
ncbi:MAG: hypothetical protein JW820_17570 [Spirochaetales bacterium]|nr:hypothetical protein [Spirochaetales bacterium]